jgi:hypothetical protein|tara:strand:- start:176 stop:403 length:228 start_codon:yes stop_codon:yes gene_type:complete
MKKAYEMPEELTKKAMKWIREYNEIEYVAKKIMEEKAPYNLQKIRVVLRKLYQSLPTGELWIDFPEYFEEYQLEE